MTDYNKLKVQELQDQLKERSLPVSGKKLDLIARLQENDSKKASQKPAAAPAAAPTSTLPAEDEIDWLEEDTTTTTAVAAPAKSIELAPTPAPASASSAPASKPAPAPTPAPAKKATTSSAAAALAAGGQGQVSNPTAVPNQKIDTDPSKTSDLTIKGDASLPSEKPFEVIAASGEATKPAEPKPAEAKSAEGTPAPDYSIGLAKVDVKTEMEKRKERAKKFGITEEEKPGEEAAKLLEREKRFGTGATTDQNAEAAVSKLDQALPERGARKRGRGGDGEDGGRERGGKRRQGQDRPRGGQDRQRDGRDTRQARQGTRRGERQRTGPGGGGGGGGGAAPKTKPAMVSEADKKKAEERKARFAAGAK